jgi:broad specificity phosphatase PhoE
LLRHLLLEVEHTWGTDTKTWLDFDHYTPSDLAAMLETKNYKLVQFSWQEKREDLLTGIAALPSPLREQAQEAVHALRAVPPRMARPSPVESVIETAHFMLGIDQKTGAIVRLYNKKSKRAWASNDHPLALFSYQTLSQQDYAAFFRSYIISQEDWAKKDFGKPNMEKFGAVSQEWLPSLTELRAEEDGQGHRLLARLAIDDSVALHDGRAAFPRTMYLEILLPSREPFIHLNFSWFQKPATRLPEALWLSFHPIAPDPAGWTMEKSGERVSPLDVVPSGNRHLHAVSKGFGYQDDKGQFLVETLDAPLVALGIKSPLYFSNQQPDMTAGVHCNLFNNAWGTNYIMWFGEDMRFRFTLRA